MRTAGWRQRTKCSIVLLVLVRCLPSVSGGNLSALCRAQLTALPAGVDRCSSFSVSERWVAGACVDRAGNLVSDGKILLSSDFTTALSGDAKHKCTALCTGEAAPLGWQQCAKQGRECACRGTARFGTNSTWLEKFVDGSIPCAREAFGGQLSAGNKTCQCRPMYTGCELVASTERNKGCYAHTSGSVRGSGAANANCWTRTPWLDSHADGCDWYRQAPHRCRVYGNSYSNNGMSALDACCACGGGSLKVSGKPYRGLQIFKGDDVHSWSVASNPPFQVDFRNSDGDAAMQLRTSCSDSRCNRVELHLSHALARGAWKGVHKISLDATASSPLQLPRLRGDAREWASDQGIILARQLLVTANGSGFKVEWAPWDVNNWYFYRSDVTPELLDVSSSVNVESLNKASISIVSGLCHPSCDLCTHFAGKFATVEEKATLCISCPSGRSLDVVHSSIAAGKCVCDSQQRFESIEQYHSTGTLNFLNIFSSNDWYPECWNELNVIVAGAVVDDTNCSNLGTHLCDDSTSPEPYQTYCSTYNTTAKYSMSSRCLSFEGDTAKCFKCEAHFADCRCGKWTARSGEIWEPYLRGSPWSPLFGALVLTACPVGQKLVGGLDRLRAQKCTACKDDTSSWPSWNITLKPSHLNSVGLSIEWRSSAGRICPNEYMSTYGSYTLIKLERNATQNESTLTRFSFGGKQEAASVRLNLTHCNFVVRLAEKVSKSGQVQVGLVFPGLDAGGSNDMFFDLGCVWTQSPAWEEWGNILNIFQKQLVVRGASILWEPVSDASRRGRGLYLNQINLVSKRAEDVAGGGECLPCPAGAVCIKGMLVFSTGANRLVSSDWGSVGGWAQSDKDGQVRLTTCPQDYTKFPFETTGILDELMDLSMQACKKTCKRGSFFVLKTGDCTTCDPGFYLGATIEHTGKSCAGGLYQTDPMKSVCIECPSVGSCPRDGEFEGMFIPPTDNGRWVLDLFGTCLLTDCGEGNVTVYKGKPDKDNSRLPNSTMECGYCEDSFRFDGARQECVKCSAKIECKNSGIKRSPCQDLTQYFDHNEDECLGCPENSVCTSLSTPVPEPQFIPKNREQLANIMKILLPYWIDESDPNSIPLGRECFSKRKDDRNADCDVPCGQNVAAENCRIAACPAGTVMIRAPGNTDISFQDRCFQCPAGFFQIFSTNHYNLNTLQPSSGLEDPILMCTPCPSGTSCSRSKAQERDFGFTVGIHILPSNGFWLNSLRLHEISGTFIYINDSLRPSRRVEEDRENEGKKTFRVESAEMVTAHRCASRICNHTGDRPKEWSGLLNPENPDWMCGEDSSRTGLACGICKEGTALTADKSCEYCGNAAEMWVFQLFAGLGGLVVGGAIWYAIVWRGIFAEEHDPYEAGRTPVVLLDPPQTNDLMSPDGQSQEDNYQKVKEGIEDVEKGLDHMKSMLEDGIADVTSRAEQVDKKRKEFAPKLDKLQDIDPDTLQTAILKVIEDYKPAALIGMFSGLWWFLTDVVGKNLLGAESTNPEDIRRALMGFFKIVMSYFQVTASFLKNFNVEWGQQLEKFLDALSILNLDLYKLPKLSCMMLTLSPTRTWQVAVYILMVPLCLLVLSIPRLLCWSASTWMLTVWERTRRSTKDYKHLIAEHQTSLTGISEVDAQRLQQAKDVAITIKERRTFISFHRASWPVRASVVLWAILLAVGFVVCFEIAVQTANKAVLDFDLQAKDAVGRKCRDRLTKLQAFHGSECDGSGVANFSTCLICGYGDYRKSASDCLMCPCGSELDVRNLDCTGVCRNLDTLANETIEWPLYKAIAEGKCFPKQGAECVITEIMGRYQFSSGNAERNLEFDIGCSVRQEHQKRRIYPSGERRFKDLTDVDPREKAPLEPEDGCPHFEARQEYTYHKDIKTWDDAEATCQIDHGHLGSFASFADMNITVGQIGLQKSTQVWIGLSQKSIHNDWVWSDGSNFTYAASNWWGSSPLSTAITKSWCNQDSRKTLSPPQPRPTRDTPECVYLALNQNVTVCADELSAIDSQRLIVTKYNGWEAAQCSAKKPFVCSKIKPSCQKVNPPTSWPPRSRDQMQGNGSYYWKAMCEIKSGNGFGAMTGEGSQPYPMCYQPWESYEEAFGIGGSYRRASTVQPSDTVPITPAQASVLIILLYVCAGVSALSWIVFFGIRKMGTKFIVILESLCTNVLSPATFAICVHGALSGPPTPLQHLHDRAEWTPGLLVLPAAVFMHLSLGFFMKPSEGIPCPWIHGAEYLALEMIYLAIASVSTAISFGFLLTDESSQELLISVGVITGLSIVYLVYAISTGDNRERERKKIFFDSGLFLTACGLGVGLYFVVIHEITFMVSIGLAAGSSILAVVCYIRIIHCWKEQAEKDGKLKFDVERGKDANYLRDLREGLKRHLEKRMSLIPLSDDLRDLDAVLQTTAPGKELQKKSNIRWKRCLKKPKAGIEIKNDMLKAALQLEGEDFKLELTQTKISAGVPNEQIKSELKDFVQYNCPTDSFIKVGNEYYARVAATPHSEWIERAGTLYGVLMDERNVAMYQMKERVTKMWLLSWTAFLFTIYPAVSAVAISGFDCEDYGEEGWRLRDHPKTLCPYRYAWDIIRRYENLDVDLPELSQIKANFKFPTSNDSPEYLFMLSVTAVFSFAIGIPLYMYLLLVITKVPQIAQKKRANASFQAFARYWRAKKVPKGIDYLAAFLVPEKEITKIVLNIPTHILQDIGLQWQQSWNQQKFEEALAKLAQVDSSEIKVKLPTLDNDKSKRSRFSRLDVRVIRNEENITADFADKLSVSEISKLMKRMLGDMKREAPYSNISDVWEVQPGDDNFPRLVDSLFKQMARSNADRTKKHQDARERRTKVKMIDEARKREEEAHIPGSKWEICWRRPNGTEHKNKDRLASELERRLDSAKNLKWERVVPEPLQNPTTVTASEPIYILDDTLVQALRKDDDAAFSTNDFESYRVKFASDNCYIQVDNNVYKPSIRFELGKQEVDNLNMSGLSPDVYVKANKKNEADPDMFFKQSAKLLTANVSSKWTVFDEDMFWIRELYDPCCKYEFRLLPETSMPIVGLEWEDMGTEKPKKCFINKELSAALQKKDGSKFTKEEFAKFKASNINSKSYIAVGDRYFRPSPAKMYVTTTDIFAFIWKKQLGTQWNQKKSLVSKERGDDDQFVQACMERQYELKKAFVELLDSLKHFDEDGGGDHDNSKGGAKKSEPHTKMLRRHFNKAREDQMELDKNEFTKMCHDVGTSATFILNTDTLGNLSSHKLETLYNFVKAQEKELTVRFDVTFETHDEQEKKPKLGGKKSQLNESDRSRGIVMRMLKEILAKQKLKPQQIEDILASVKIDENEEGGKGEEEDEDTDEGNADEEKDQHDQNEDDDKVDDSPDGVQVHGGNYGEPERGGGGDEITLQRDEDEAAGVQARQVGGELEEVADKRDKNTPWSFGNLGIQEKFYAHAERFNNGMFKWKGANAQVQDGKEPTVPKIKPTVPIHLVVTFPITLLEKTIRRDVLTVENINKAVLLINDIKEDSKALAGVWGPVGASLRWENVRAPGTQDKEIKDDSFREILEGGKLEFKKAELKLITNKVRLSHECYIQGGNGTCYKPGGKCTSVDVKFIKETSKPKNDADKAVLEVLGDAQKKQEEASCQGSKNDSAPVVEARTCVTDLVSLKKTFVTFKKSEAYKFLFDVASERKLGWKWENIGLEKPVKATAIEITNDLLVAALQKRLDSTAHGLQSSQRKGDSFEFNNQKLCLFTALYKKVAGEVVTKERFFLSSNCYIKVNKNYYIPTGNVVSDHEKDRQRIRERTTAIIKHIEKLEEIGTIKVDTVAWDKFGSEEEKRAINRAGFLFVNYEVQYWWYEIYETIKKLYFTCMVTLLQDGSSFRQMAAFLVNFAALIIHLTCRPFVNGKLDNMQAYSILVQTVTIFYSIMLFIMQSSDDSNAGSSGGRFFVQMLVILVNCFVTIFPLLNTISSNISSGLEEAGLGQWIRRIPFESGILLFWDGCLLFLAALVCGDRLPIGSTAGAYFQLAFLSFACFIGLLLSLTLLRVLFDIVLYVYGRYKNHGYQKSYKGQRTLLYMEYFDLFWHIFVIWVFWVNLAEASIPGPAMNKPRAFILAASICTMIFTCGKMYYVDNLAKDGWKALQMKKDDEAFGVVYEEDDDEDEDGNDEQDNAKAGGDKTEGNDGQKKESIDNDSGDGQEDEESQEGYDSEYSDDDEDSHGSDDQEEESQRMVCTTCGVKSKEAAKALAPRMDPSNSEDESIMWDKQSPRGSDSHSQPNMQNIGSPISLSFVHATLVPSPEPARAELQAKQHKGSLSGQSHDTEMSMPTPQNVIFSLQGEQSYSCPGKTRVSAILGHLSHKGAAGTDGKDGEKGSLSVDI